MSKEKIIVALDVSGENQAKEIITELRGEVGGFKIGLQLFTAIGSDFVRKLASEDVKIFLDLKFHDIPNTVAKASIEVARLGVWMFNIHTLGGSEMMRRTVEEVREVVEKERLKQPKIIGVTILTSSNDKTLQEVGINSNTSDQVSKLAQLAAKSGLDGVVASPQEVGIIRQNIDSKNFLIVTPGIRPAQKTQINADDQKRATTPAEALENGADYLVIGRPITQSQDMQNAVREIISNMEIT